MARPHFPIDVVGGPGSGTLFPSTGRAAGLQSLLDKYTPRCSQTTSNADVGLPSILAGPGSLQAGGSLFLPTRGAWGFLHHHFRPCLPHLLSSSSAADLCTPLLNHRFTHLPYTPEVGSLAPNSAVNHEPKLDHLGLRAGTGHQTVGGTGGEASEPEVG